MAHKQVLIWYRNDLRVHDHEPLSAALNLNAEIIPAYCFDPRQFGQTSYGFPKTGAFRAQFLLESVEDLRQSLQQLGSDLIIRTGKPETLIPELVKTLKIDAVYYYQEATSEELRVEQRLKTALNSLGVDLQSYWGATLYSIPDLPFSIAEIPEVFTQFRKKVENHCIVNPPFPSPQKLPPLPKLELGILPTLQDLGLEPPVVDFRAVLTFKGGETTGLKRLNDYIWQQDCLKNYKETRNGMLGANYSSKFSAWLALGCLSPRFIYNSVKKYEVQRIKNDSTYWLIFELLWRDYFRLIALKHGNKIFYSEGLRGLSVPWKEDLQQFESWKTGMTGFPLIDANMRELALTGFMSNRGRQNVASFLTKNLGIHWKMGAEWFESLLIDYDVCSNWGNWNYTAGVGNDARGFRYFNILKQSKDYDLNGDYVKHWLPELSNLPPSKVHEPWSLIPVEQKRFGVILGVDYPQPIVNLEKSVKANQSIYEVAERQRSTQFIPGK
ncbi:Cryptochrome DASH [Planktothrix tepida]|uniref:Cryptochrome DASH n=1 Tax=Planktothrix tepida PCC 9214 TaxID=671072 RepID=A0A1J1LQV3_9CYAN|nr:DASH family cryptochrome [Planktothrix tepida]CAD5964145.1 Cryptochrome DASH [Planktothrix tepida]CUR34933.1 Cryptochrome DASH [Planktothrix tepida PCC 9214]